MTTNLQFTSESTQILTVQTSLLLIFLLSGLGPRIAPKALANVASPAEGRVCFSRETVMVTNELRPAAGGDCPGATPAEPDDRSTVMEGTL
jgi:hypothetical protein